MYTYILYLIFVIFIGEKNLLESEIYERQKYTQFSTESDNKTSRLEMRNRFSKCYKCQESFQVKEKRIWIFAWC